VATLMCFAAAGALVFALSRDLAGLSVGRALIGLGVSAGLMGAIKAFSLWFPLSRLATMNGLFLAVGGLGGLSATAPAEALVDALGWRGMFSVLAGASAAAALAVFFIVPEKPLPGGAQSLREQFTGFARVYSSRVFWRIVLPLVVGQATYLSLQGLWLGPWLYDVAGLERAQVSRYLLVTVVGYIAGSLFFGITADRLAQYGVSRLQVYKIGLFIALAMLALIAAGIHQGLGLALPIYAFAGISSSLAYALLTPLFPPEMTGRVSTACNVLMFAFSFVVQWGIGIVLRLYPVIDGRYAAAGYTAAFTALAVLQLATLAWLAPMRAPQFGDGARTAGRATPP